MRVPFALGRSEDSPESSSAQQGPPLLQIGSKDLFFLEQYKALRARFEQQASVRKCRVVAVTSAISGEGKTMVSANLGAQLAATGGRRVLLADLDLRKADLGDGFGLGHQPGLNDFLSGKAALADVVRKPGPTGLSVIPAGRRNPDPADLLTGERFNFLIDEIRLRYDIVIFDTPPVIPVADALSVRGRLDGFIFVFRADFTPCDMFRQATEEIGRDNILGVVINGVQPFRQAYYQRYYGAYYRKPRQ